MNRGRRPEVAKKPYAGPPPALPEDEEQRALDVPDDKTPEAPHKLSAHQQGIADGMKFFMALFYHIFQNDPVAIMQAFVAIRLVENGKKPPDRIKVAFSTGLRQWRATYEDLRARYGGRVFDRVASKRGRPRKGETEWSDQDVVEEKQTGAGDSSDQVDPGA
jgi:hypothetical protein